MPVNDFHNNIWFFKVDDFSKSRFQFILFVMFRYDDNYKIDN